MKRFFTNLECTKRGKINKSSIYINKYSLISKAKVRNNGLYFHLQFNYNHIYKQVVKLVFDQDK